MFPEALEPLSNTGSTGSQTPRNGRDRFPFRRQQNHTGTPVKPGFASLLPNDCLKIVPFPLGKHACHDNGIDTELRLPVSQLMASSTRHLNMRGCANYAPTRFSIQSIETDLGRVIAVPSARFQMSCDNIPSDRETPNKTV